MLTSPDGAVMLEMKTREFAAVSGGPLHGEYVFAQLHFHWGANDSFGSEDRINNHSFPMELHMVFYKLEYGDVPTAMRFKDGLAVFAVFYEVSLLLCLCDFRPSTLARCADSSGTKPVADPPSDFSQSQLAGDAKQGYRALPALVFEVASPR